MDVTVVSVMFRLSNGRSIELTLQEMAALREQFDRIGVAVTPRPAPPSLPSKPPLCGVKRK